MLVDQVQFKEELSAGCELLELDLPDEAIEQLLFFLEQLHRWNKAYNLSGIKDPAKMLTHHLLDSLSVYRFFKAQNVADVGTGAGLPGIPLAICKPETTFYLIDSNSKKTRFIFQTVSRLGLKNIQVVHSRAQDHKSSDLCEIITSRAFASLKDFVNSAAHLMSNHPDARMLAMKGKEPDDEIHGIPESFYMHNCTLYFVPGMDAERCIVDIRKKQ